MWRSLKPVNGNRPPGPAQVVFTEPRERRGGIELFPRPSQTRIAQAHQRPLYDYSLLFCPPPSVSKVPSASSLPTCRDHHPRALDKQDKPRGMGAAILLTQRPPGCWLSGRARSWRGGARGGASSGVEFSKDARPRPKGEPRARARSRAGRGGGRGYREGEEGRAMRLRVRSEIALEVG